MSQPWLHALALTPLITEAHLEVLRRHGFDVPSGVLVEVTQPESPWPTVGLPQTLYELNPAVHESIKDRPSPFDSGQLRRLHRDFGRALVREERDPDVWLALRHARLAEDWEIVNLLWVRHALGLINRSMETAAWAFGSLPDEALRKYPFLRFAATFFDPTLASSDGADLRATLRAVFGLLAAVVRALPTNRNGIITLHLLTGLMVQQRNAGSLARAQSAAKRVGAELDRQTRNGGVGDAGLEGWCLLQMGMTALLSGELEEARALTLDAYEAALAGGIDAAQNVVNSAAQLATICALEGSAAEAERWIEISDRHHCHPWFDRLMRLPARIAEAMVAIDRLEPVENRFDREREGGWRGVEMWPYVTRIAARGEILCGSAPRALLDLERSRANHPGPRGGAQPLELELLLAGPQADALIAVGQAGRAKRALERIAEGTGKTADQVPGIAVPYARALLHCGETIPAKRVARAVANGDGPHPRVDKLEASFLHVEILAFQGYLDQARDAFRLAREVVDELQLWRIYATMDPILLDTLVMGGDDPLPAPVQSWLERHGPVFPPLRHRPHLTKRELVVLDHLASQLAFTEIAEELSVSVNTVKSQVSSLYRKLEASSRPEALAAAARFGLLDELDAD